MQALSGVYGAAATWRRQWYARDPRRVRRLARPVISVGNLRVGGSGKTPAVACLARLLLAHGERPAILSRGYGRETAAPGVTVVSDGTGVRVGVAEAGDEPLLLARSLPQVPVLVCADRHAAGVEAERQFGTTVHLLDDGFQHVRLARDLDLLLVDAGDLHDRVLPAGRLREPLSNAAVADAVLVASTDIAEVSGIARALGVREAFQMERSLGEPTWLSGGVLPDRSEPVFAVAGIAKPERFFDDLRAGGWQVGGTRTFRDHHRFTSSDVARTAAEAARSGARAILTTEKDAVRLEPLLAGPRPAAASAAPASLVWAAVPLRTAIRPAAAFEAWLLARLTAVRR